MRFWRSKHQENEEERERDSREEEWKIKGMEEWRMDEWNRQRDTWLRDVIGERGWTSKEEKEDSTFLLSYFPTFLLPYLTSLLPVCLQKQELNMEEMCIILHDECVGEMKWDEVKWSEVRVETESHERVAFLVCNPAMWGTSAVLELFGAWPGQSSFDGRREAEAGKGELMPWNQGARKGEGRKREERKRAEVLMPWDWGIHSTCRGRDGPGDRLRARDMGETEWSSRWNKQIEVATARRRCSSAAGLAFDDGLHLVWRAVEPTRAAHQWRSGEHDGRGTDKHDNYRQRGIHSMEETPPVIWK